MHRASFIASTLLTLAALAAGCGPGRTAAATQSTPAAFDATKSDAKAIELVDQTIAACGGDAAWQKAKEVRFHVTMADGGSKLVDVTHIWDKWNGRHQFRNVAQNGKEQILTYEIYGDMAFAADENVPRSVLGEWVPEAKNRLWIDSYTLFMVFKLKDPGVILKLDGERADQATPDKPVYDVVKVSFESGVASAAGDRYWLVIKKEDHLPAWIEWAPAGKPDDYRIAYRWEEWKDVGGLKLSTKRVNIGHEAEVITFDGIELRGEPEEELYIKQVR
jgi:hypothetical protein